MVRQNYFFVITVITVTADDLLGKAGLSSDCKAKPSTTPVLKAQAQAPVGAPRQRCENRTCISNCLPTARPSGSTPNALPSTLQTAPIPVFVFRPLCARPVLSSADKTDWASLMELHSSNPSSQVGGRGQEDAEVT